MVKGDLELSSTDEHQDARMSTMCHMQARRRVSIFGGAGVKKIIIFIPMRSTPPSTPTEKEMVRV